MAAGSPFVPNPSDQELVAHERTYKAFNILLRWCMTLLGASLSFLTLWLATAAGFIGGLVVGIIVLALGYSFLVRHESDQPLDVWTEGR
jgi:hypothetical protein